MEQLDVFDAVSAVRPRGDRPAAMREAARTFRNAVTGAARGVRTVTPSRRILPSSGPAPSRRRRPLVPTRRAAGPNARSVAAPVAAGAR